MLNYEEELKKFKPSLEVDQIEEACLQGRSDRYAGYRKRGYGKERKNGEKIER